MRFGRTAWWVLAIALTLPTPSPAVPLVNGSFEPAAPFGPYLLLGGGSTAIPGWTTTDSGAEWFQPTAYGYAAAPDGLYIVDVANYVYSAGGIRQSFATVPGASYAIDFRLGTHAASGRDGTCQVVVDADGQSQVFSHATAGAAIAWLPCTFTFVADDATATLRFRCLQNANLHFAYLDGAGLRDLTTPAAPASWGRIKSLFR